jgi:hypothetical protein
MQPTHIVDRDPHSDQAFAYFEFPYSFVLEEPEAYVEKFLGRVFRTVEPRPRRALAIAPVGSHVLNPGSLLWAACPPRHRDAG